MRWNQEHPAGIVFHRLHALPIRSPRDSKFPGNIEIEFNYTTTGISRGPLHNEGLKPRFILNMRYQNQFDFDHLKVFG